MVVGNRGRPSANYRRSERPQSPGLAPEDTAYRERSTIAIQRLLGAPQIRKCNSAAHHRASEARVDRQRSFGCGQCFLGVLQRVEHACVVSKRIRSVAVDFKRAFHQPIRRGKILQPFR